MKQSIINSGGGGGGRRCTIPSQNEVEVVEILLNLPKLIAKSELISKYSFTWGRRKKRSVLVSKSETPPLTHREVNESLPEKVTAADEADKSPSTPLCFLASGSGSGSDGVADTPKQQKKNSKRKATDDLIERYNEMQQQREILVRKVKAMENLYQELRVQNLELKRKRQEINPRNMDEFHLWNKSAKLNHDQQHYHRQITMFATPPPPPVTAPAPAQQLQQHCQQLMKMACSGNSNGGRFGFFNQIDPRVKIHGETFDFMATSQPLDQSKYLLLDNDLRARTAAEARKWRIMKMKESKNSSMAMKLSRACR